jgi:hypothetical protein
MIRWLKVVNQAGQPIDPQSNISASRSEFHALHQQTHDAGLFYWKQLIPECIELLEGLSGLIFGEIWQFSTRFHPRPHDDFWPAEQAPDLIHDGSLDLSSRDTPHYIR